MHLRLHALLEKHLALRQNFGMNVRPQIARHRIDRLILLFDPDGEGAAALDMSVCLSPRSEVGTLLFAASYRYPSRQESLTV